MDMDKRVKEILDFWFGDFPDDSVPASEKQKEWWIKDESLDDHIRDNYGQYVIQASEGMLDKWLETPEGTLALIILLDQFPRNIYRGRAKAFSFDTRSLEIARYGIDRGFDQKLHPAMRIFFYLPFMHSEDRRDQERSVELYRSLLDEYSHNEEINKLVSNSLDFAYKHKEIIERFGRFPHRNEILGRESTPEEIEFLKQPGSSF